MDVEQVAAAAHLMAAAQLYGHCLRLRCLGRVSGPSGKVQAKLWCDRCHSKEEQVLTANDGFTLHRWMQEPCKARRGA